MMEDEQVDYDSSSSSDEEGIVSEVVVAMLEDSMIKDTVVNVVDVVAQPSGDDIPEKAEFDESAFTKLTPNEQRAYIATIESENRLLQCIILHKVLLPNHTSFIEC
jgi:hypothetical protein